MAHVLVHLERSPQGLHPASAVAVCLARDLGSSRGAAVFAVCSGDAGPFDDHVAVVAAKCGADQVIFVGPTGTASLVQRLRPKHVFYPWTRNATELAQAAGLEAPTPAWIGGPVPDSSGFTRVMGIVAGTLPWHNMAALIDSEFEGQVDQSPVPDWLADAGGELQRGGGIFYVAPQDLDPQLRANLEAIGAQAVAPDYANTHQSGTLIWLDAGPAGLPEVLSQRPPQARVIALPGPLTEIHKSWTLADWVIPGPWELAAKMLHQDHWKAALT